jgi:uroporphyrinogen decarboxylase
VTTSHDRVLTACAFRQPDRIPRFESFWQYPDTWQARLGDREGLTDVVIWYPDETPFPSRARPLGEEKGYVIEADAWGRITRRCPGAFFVETLQAAISQPADLDRLEFDSPHLDSRYLTGKMDPSVTHPNEAVMRQALADDKARHCVFGKTGGPYLRSTYLRGEMEFLTDIAADPPFARAIAERVGDHLIAVGVEQLRRWGLHDTGLWIYDDMAYNRGPMFSPRQFEQIFLPIYRRMVAAYKEAGAKYVFLHSDGDIRSLLEMLVAAGIDGINPLERRAHMDVLEVRKRFPRLILTGGMCNTKTLVSGTRDEIEAEARQIIELGRDGGVVIGSHSVSPEIPLENFVIYHETCEKYGSFV